MSGARSGCRGPDSRTARRHRTHRTHRRPQRVSRLHPQRIAQAADLKGELPRDLPSLPRQFPFFKLLARGGLLANGALSAAFCAFCAFCVSLPFENQGRPRHPDLVLLAHRAIRVSLRLFPCASAFHASLLPEFREENTNETKNAQTGRGRRSTQLAARGPALAPRPLGTHRRAAEPP